MNHLKEVLYLGRVAFTLTALLFAINVVFSSFLITQIVVLLSNNDEYKAYGSLSDFNFAAAGDWGCKSRTVDTVNNIVNKNPELVLGLGDFSYEHTADCWFGIIAPLDDKMKITIGNHDDETTALLNQYMSHFNLTKQFYSFNYQNVHFTVISTELIRNNSEGIELTRNESEANEQYEFVNADLASAASDPNIDWIVVYYHKEAYTSPYITSVKEEEIRTALNRLRDAYHPLFEKYDVDLVLQAHNHNYERSYPIKYNNANSSVPIITDANTNNNYSNPEGQIFVTVGTGGRGSYGFLAKEPYMVTQYVGYGFLNIDVIDKGQTFNATFYSNDGSIKDQFSIKKNGSTTADI
jgi:Calcineurin-like phosphoesterase